MGTYLLSVLQRHFCPYSCVERLIEQLPLINNCLSCAHGKRPDTTTHSFPSVTGPPSFCPLPSTGDCRAIYPQLGEIRRRLRSPTACEERPDSHQSETRMWTRLCRASTCRTIDLPVRQRGQLEGEGFTRLQRHTRLVQYLQG